MTVFATEGDVFAELEFEPGPDVPAEDGVVFTCSRGKVCHIDPNVGLSVGPSCTASYVGEEAWSKGEPCASVGVGQEVDLLLKGRNARERNPIYSDLHVHLVLGLEAPVLDAYL